MGLDEEYTDGQTLLDEDEKEGLLITSITTRGELDEFEQKNIEQAITWSIRRNFKLDEILQEKFVRDLHKRMYGEVWGWAGHFRTTNKNIGVDKYEIPVQLRSLLDDCKYWIEHHSFDPDEIVITFKHRLVSIHCFPNGNGRHSRLVADIMIEKLFHRPVFTWGAVILTKPGEARKAYLDALKAADQGDLKKLIKFARS